MERASDRHRSVDVRKSFQVCKLGFRSPVSAKEVSSTHAVVERALKGFSAIADVFETKIRRQRRLSKQQIAVLGVRCPDVRSGFPLCDGRHAHAYAKERDGTFGNCPQLPSIHLNGVDALSTPSGWPFEVNEHNPSPTWFDESKSYVADFRHRALRHHAEGIFMAERIFGSTILNSDGKAVPVRYLGEQHVKKEPGSHSFLPRLDSGVAHAPVDVPPEAGEDSETLSVDFDALQHFPVVSPLRPFLLLLVLRAAAAFLLVTP
jgi:hypothetical protein